MRGIPVITHVIGYIIAPTPACLSDFDLCLPKAVRRQKQQHIRCVRRSLNRPPRPLRLQLRNPRAEAGDLGGGFFVNGFLQWHGRIAFPFPQPIHDLTHGTGPFVLLQARLSWRVREVRMLRLSTWPLHCGAHPAPPAARRSRRVGCDGSNLRR